MADDDVVLCEVVDRVATLTINRPEVRNALNAAVLDRLPRLVLECESSDDVDVMILTGADPAFSAGVDLKEAGSGGSQVGRADAGAGGRGPLPPTTKPVIGAINGFAVTGGLELALACDFLVASERARFADTHARVGLMPGWGLTVWLPEAIGVRRARHMSFTGNYVDADTALAWGLVNEVVPHAELLPACRALAADIVSNDQAGVRRMRQTYAEGALVTGADAWTLEAGVSRSWRATGGGSAEEIERRRASIIDRGRAQQS
jgi:enoyl-CoA hydratase